jgi:hypothetical protein
MRLFTFGCSFTSYKWPTWANILGRQFNTFENWGRSGAGNQYIFNSIVEANITRCFTPQDTIAIMWTNVSREDRYVEREWLTPGNIYNQNLYDSKFVEKFADTRGYYIRDLALIWAADRLLENIGCNIIHFSITDIANPAQYTDMKASSEISDLINYYQPVLSKILPSVHCKVFNYNWYSRPNCITRQTLDTVVAQVCRKGEFLSWYNNIRDSSWPSCNSEDDFINLPDHIQKECYEDFGYRPNKIQSKSSKFQKLLPNVLSRQDTHPTPVEHLEYLERVIPNFNIDTDSKIWAKEIDICLQTGQDYSNFWIPYYLKRW